MRFVLGPAFRDSVPVLRVFSLWIPLIALTTVIIFQLLLPNQLDNQFNFVNFTTPRVAIDGLIRAGAWIKGDGDCWAAVIAQLYTLVAFSFIVWRAGLNPFAARPLRVEVFVPVLAGTSKPARGSEEVSVATYGERQRIS